MKTDMLQSEVALVTGAASGIGRSVALELSNQGAKVICCDFNAEENQETAQMIRDAGGESTAIFLNTNDSKCVKEVMKEAFDWVGKISILLNGAGIVRFSPIEVCEDEEWDEVMRTNITGYFYCLREVYPYMKKSGGSIIQLSSTSAKSGSSFGGPHYAAAKGGVISLSKYAARRWAKDGIRVNTICPGAMDTPMLRQEGAPKGSVEGMEALVPMGRLGQPNDIAGTVVYLASSQLSGYVTGITIDVTGGRYLYGN